MIELKVEIKSTDIIVTVPAPNNLGKTKLTSESKLEIEWDITLGATGKVTRINSAKAFLFREAN